MVLNLVSQKINENTLSGCFNFMLQEKRDDNCLHGLDSVGSAWFYC